MLALEVGTMRKAGKKVKNWNPKTFLVTGASGFLGYHMCKYLLRKGCKVKGIDIAPFEYKDLKNKVEFFQGDIRNRSLLRKALKGVDVVIHGAAALPLWPKREIFSVNVKGTRIVLEEALKQGVKEVIFISSTSIYGIPKHHPVTEDYKSKKGVGMYGKSKILAEKVCLEFRRKGLVVPIIRPKTFAGPLRLGVFHILCDWVASGKNIPIVGRGNNKYQLLHIDDLVEAIYMVAKADPSKANDTFNVGATEFNTMKKDLQALLDYAGFGKRVIGIPSWLVIPVLKVLEFFKLSPLYAWVYETADKDHYVDVSKIERVIGFKPKKSTAQVWIDTYKWFVKNKDKIKKTGVTHRVAWKQGALSIAKKFF